MSTTLLAARIAAAMAFKLATSADIGKGQQEVDWSPSFNFTDGTGADQAKVAFADERTLSASSNEELDLAGGLTDLFGNTITFTKIKALLVVADAGNTNDVLVGGAGSNGFITPFGDATDVIKVKPGGLLLLVAPNATGYAVTASTGDKLKIANSSSGSSVTYQIGLLGVV